MDTETEKTCPSCGKPLKEGVAFCTNCGAATGATGEPVATDGTSAGEPMQPLPPSEAANVPPVPPGAVPPGPPAAGVAGGETPAAGYVPVPSPGKNKTALIVGVIGGLLVVAGIVVLVLWLTMWRDGSAGGTGDPIGLAEKYISALEKGDVDAYLACFEEDFLENDPMLEGMGMDMKELLEMSFEMMEVQFEGYALELEYEEGDKARVVTTEGSVTMSVMGFEQEYDLAEDPMVFEMIKQGGRWYLTKDPMPGSMGGDVDFDMEDFEELDFEDMEDEEDFNLEDLDLEYMEDLLPEDMNLEDLENMTEEDLEKMLEELEKLMEGMPEKSST